MKNIFNYWKLIVMSLIIGTLSIAIPVNASTIVAPTLLKINTFKAYAVSAPVISGVAPKNSNVLVFIDGIFAGNAVTKVSNTSSDSFYFQAFKLSEGVHKAYLVSENKEDLSRSMPSKTFDISVNKLSAPTLVVPNKTTVTGKVKPLIEGFTNSGTFVHIFIDGKYFGKTDIVENANGTAHFTYSPFLNLSVGSHKMWAVSEDISGRKSKASEIVEFRIEEKMPAPTLLGLGLTPDKSRYTISGLAKNNSKIKVFVDKKIDGEFQVKNHISGTANFSYTLKQKTGNKKPLIYVTAVDSRGKESLWSNIISDKKITKPKQVSIGEASSGKVSIKAESEEANTKVAYSVDLAEKTKDFLVYAELYKNDQSIKLNDSQYKELEKLLVNKKELALKNDELKDLEALLASKADSSVKTEETKKGDLNIEDVLKNDLSTNTEEKGGLVNENKKQQGKLGWNAFIFILFLFAIIAWIFWVNRELIKEKQEQEANKEKSDKK